VFTAEIPPDWYRTAEILKSKPGEISEQALPEEEEGVVPVFHCSQEIPCNPCTAACPQGLIEIDPTDIRKLPSFIGEEVGQACIGCQKCVTICPGLAVTLVDYRKSEPGHAVVTLAYEFLQDSIDVGDVVTVLDAEGRVLGNVEVIGVRAVKAFDRTIALRLKAPREYAKRIAGVQVQERQVTEPMDHYVERLTDDTIVCRCERVTAGEIRSLIRQGYRDMNEIKAVSRAGMGACGAKTCTGLIHRLFREEGISLDKVVDQSLRPLFMEVPLAVFAGADGNQPG
jgi:ferredoxin